MPDPTHFIWQSVPLSLVGLLSRAYRTMAVAFFVIGATLDCIDGGHWRKRWRRDIKRKKPGLPD